MPIARPWLAAVAVFFLPLQMHAGDWPQWRGPNRDAVWNETGILETFPADGLKTCWRAPVGFGWSSPTIAGGRVYVTDAQQMKPKATERVHCFDEATGKTLWCHSYDVAYPDWAFPAGQEGHPTSTPIVQDGKVYTLGQKGHLHCLDAAKGTVLWTRNLETEYKVQEFAFSCSPLIDGDLLILCIGSFPPTHQSLVVALDRKTGKEAWKSPTEGVTNSSPIVITAGRKRQLIAWTQGGVVSLDPATGKSFWTERMKTSADGAVATPVFHKDQLLISGLMMKLDSEKPVARVVWPDSRAVPRRVLSNTSTPLIQGDCVFSAKSPGLLVCLDVATGKQRWETDKVTAAKGGASIHLTPQGGSVLLYTDEGNLIRAKLDATGYQEISRVRLVEPIFPFAGKKLAWSPPAYANKHVFVRSDKEVVCLSLAAR